ncbi:hypothetical protein ACF0H5_018271 [Mactra antiquata]
MKFLLAFLIPVVFAAPKERFIIGPLQVDSLFDLDALKCDVQIILDVVGSDPTEAACELECHRLITEGSVLDHGCPLVCHAIQNLATYFHETPKPGEANQTCGGLKIKRDHESRRFLFGNFTVENIFDLDTLKCDVQIILDVVGSDPTEAACEAECQKVITDGNILEHSCPLVCHAIQNLANYFHETPKPGQQNAACGGLPLAALFGRRNAKARKDKRFLIGPLQVESIFDLDTLKCDVQIILDVVGSDPTEAACEAECVKIITDGNILNHGCPLVCHAIQNLAHYFHETPQPGAANQPCGGASIGGLLGRR